MNGPESPDAGPPLHELEEVFRVYETRVDGDELQYFGTPLAPGEDVVRALWPIFRRHGYEIRLDYDYGEWVVVAEPVELGVDGIPWTNVALAVATVLSTLFAGAAWYHLDPFSPEIIHAWPFALGIMTVLGVHEFGHYAMSRYHRVNASLPYFIPVPTLIGTLGAVIKMKGQIPSRKALFDIGVSGPIAGIVATIAVTVVGLYLPPVTAPPEVVESQSAIQIQLGFPPLLEFLAWITGQPLVFDDPATAVNPVVIAGWVGMLITFLNMIPVGQLDGGHVVRSIIGERQETVAALVPAVLFGLAAYLHYVQGVALEAVMVWGIWGVLALFLSFVGPAAPIDDAELGRGRVLVGLFAFVFGLLCFTPVPIQIVG